MQPPMSHQNPQPGSRAWPRTRPRSWEDERVFHDGDEYFKQLSQAIDQATRSVDLETYIFDRDRLGRALLRTLSAASRRGVKVRLLLDGFGCANWTYARVAALKRMGIQARFYHPLPWQRATFSLRPTTAIRQLLLGIYKLNRRNHRKSCVIDGRSAFLGGMNISARHSRAHAGDRVWRDSSVYVRGEEVLWLTRAFDSAWQHANSLRQPWPYRSFAGDSDGLVRVNVSRPQRRADYRDLLERIVSARERVWITTPYFVPDRHLLRALRFSAWSGADVRILVPGINDVWGVKWASQALYLPALLAGAKIHEYAPTVLHAKVAMIDSWVRIGSSNLNGRTLYHDLEADVVLSSPESIRAVERQFREDLHRSLEIEANTWKDRSRLRGLAETFLLRLRKWI